MLETSALSLFKILTDPVWSYPAMALLPLTPLVTAASAGLAEEEDDVVDGAVQSLED